MKAVGYVRVSTDHPAERFGAMAQLDDIRALCRREGLGLDEGEVYVDDGVDGDLPPEERPGLAAAIARLKDGQPKALVVADLDRLARNITGQEAALGLAWDTGAVVYCERDLRGEVPREDPEDPYRTAMREMRGVFGRLERAVAIARMRTGRRAKLERDRWGGGLVPYGFRVEDKLLVPDEGEQTMIREIRRRHGAGASTRGIARWLNGQRMGGIMRYPTRRGGEWSSVTVARLLKDRS